MSEQEWKVCDLTDFASPGLTLVEAELEILLGDLTDEDGNLKRSTDLKSDAGVAWQKV
jgi:hypothetical protein